MTVRTIHTLAPAIAAAAACYGTGAMAQVPAAVAAPGETTVATFQGEGAQRQRIESCPLYPQKRTLEMSHAISGQNHRAAIDPFSASLDFLAV